ncbi:collagen alpha-3(V) chain [Platysternon megacephalum]|uniref:Collagen alpha-3(V) chain n=1 Tax=Platysternon megacephalum TaxID=55544 RepID=A0A4D9DK95_9SAUR|nr:collagen alpha-3(V) chain [Platysternon megacephalum]
MWRVTLECAQGRGDLVPLNLLLQSHFCLSSNWNIPSQSFSAKCQIPAQAGGAGPKVSGSVMESEQTHCRGEETDWLLTGLRGEQIHSMAWGERAAEMQQCLQAEAIGGVVLPW